MAKSSIRLFAASAGFATLFASSAFAQGIRDTDTRIGDGEIADLLSGQVIEFFDGSKAAYGADGAYSYTYNADTEPFRGTYEAKAGGEVCVLFDNGFSRCDTYVLAGDRLVLIVADGTRFPVRTRSPL